MARLCEGADSVLEKTGKGQDGAHIISILVSAEQRYVSATIRLLLAHPFDHARNSVTKDIARVGEVLVGSAQGRFPLTTGLAWWEDFWNQELRFQGWPEKGITGLYESLLRVIQEEL